jgi:hypothetical protein
VLFAGLGRNKVVRLGPEQFIQPIRGLRHPQGRGRVPTLAACQELTPFPTLLLYCGREFQGALQFCQHSFNWPSLQSQTWRRSKVHPAPSEEALFCSSFAVASLASQAQPIETSIFAHSEQAPTCKPSLLTSSKASAKLHWASLCSDLRC